MAEKRETISTFKRKLKELQAVRVNQYAYEDSPGKPVKQSHRFWKFAEVICDYENKKLSYLGWYPTFHEIVNSIRERFGIKPELFSRIRSGVVYVDQEPSVEYLSLVTARDSYAFFAAISDPFMLVLETCVGPWIRGETTYILSAYYVLYSKIPDTRIVAANSVLQKGGLSGGDLQGDIDTFQSFLASPDSEYFKQQVKHARQFLKVCADGGVEAVGSAYARYNDYLGKAGLFLGSRNPFYRAVHDLFTELEMLNVESEPDYLLAVTYILFNRALLPDDVFTYSQAGLLRFKEFPSAPGRLYLELAWGLSDNYMSSLSSYITRVANRYHNIGWHRKQPELYYRNRAAYIFSQRHSRKGLTAEEKLRQIHTDLVNQSTKVPVPELANVNLEITYNDKFTDTLAKMIKDYRTARKRFDKGQRVR